MILIGAICGAGIGLGLSLLVLGIRGTEHAPPPRRPARELLAGEPIVLQGILAFAAALMMWIVTGWVVGAALAAMLAVLMPRSWRRARGQVELVERTEAIAAWTEMLRDTLAATAGLEQAIVTAAPNAPDPIRPEVVRLARRLDRGERLVAGLRRLAVDLANPAADLVVAALVTAAQREARDLVPLLGSLARSTRAQAEMRMRIHASRARLRTAVRVIVGSLGTFAGGLILFNPRYLEPYQIVTGQLVLLLVASIFAGAYVLMQRMARLRTPDRFLTRVGSESVLEVRT
jgi:tight adherence protein B